ncbi:MAG: hypothetical protein KBD24_01980 [Candidatus Pacebacteria bacterium]|nr:hypothetical protein [Candidatus Paceibacterota bacterium]
MGSKKNDLERQPHRSVDIDVQDEVPITTHRERRKIAMEMLGANGQDTLRDFENNRNCFKGMLGGELGPSDLLRAMNRLQELHPVDDRFVDTKRQEAQASCTNCRGSYPVATASRYLALCYVPSSNTHPVLCVSCREAFVAGHVEVVVFSV